MTSLADIGEVDSMIQNGPFAEIAALIAYDLHGVLGRDDPTLPNPFRLSLFCRLFSREGTNRHKNGVTVQLLQRITYRHCDPP
jgi:hypothetical protein